MGRMRTKLTHRVPRKAEPLQPESRKRLQRLAQRASAADAELRLAIVEVREAGVSFRDIADATGFTPEGVSKIVRREQDR